MGTTAQRFYPHSVDWDGTDPASGDVRTCETALPALNTTSSCDFGTSGAKTITVDPYTARPDGAPTGVDSKFGWAIDIAGADGMDGTATAKRVILGGQWLFQGTLTAAPVASLAACTIGMRVYRVAASPSTTRTLLGSNTFNAGTIAVAATTWEGFIDTMPYILLEPGETIQVTYTLACTGQIGGLVITFRTGDSALTNDTLFDVPSPGVRTEHYLTLPATGGGAATFGVNIATDILNRLTPGSLITRIKTTFVPLD